MKSNIIRFFQKQNFVIVSTINGHGSLHNSCKGILKINRDGTVYLLDLYRGKTLSNLRRNPRISLTAVDEHKFEGYCLKGKAKIVEIAKVKSPMLEHWEKRITDRITHRIIKNIRGDLGHPKHPEALLPKPKYLIVVKVKDITDLTPYHIKK